MNFDEMDLAVEQAEYTLRLADKFTNRMARMIQGRLQSGDVCHSALKSLKRELANYNIHTGKWKEES